MACVKTQLERSLQDLAARVEKAVGETRAAVNGTHDARIDVEKQLVAKALELQVKIETLEANITSYVQRVAKDAVEHETKNIGKTTTVPTVGVSAAMATALSTCS